MRLACLPSIESGKTMETTLNHQLSTANLELKVNSRIQLSQQIHLPFTGKIKLAPDNLEVKLAHINSTKSNTVLSGKDQANFQDLHTHLFGVRTESLQKLPNKVLSVIAGSFLLPLLLPLSHLEFTASSLILSILMMVLSRCTSTSEVRKSVLPLMIESQFSILVIITHTHIHQ